MWYKRKWRIHRSKTFSPTLSPIHGTRMQLGIGRRESQFRSRWFVCCIFHERWVSILVDARRERDDRSRDPRRWRGTNHARSHHWTRFIIRDARVCEKLRFFTAHGGFTARDRGDYAATRVYQKPSKLVRHPCVSPASASSSKFSKKHGILFTLLLP